MIRYLLPLLLICAAPCPAQQTGCFKVSAEHSLELDSNIDFGNYNAFFVGEFHGVYGVFEIELALIKFLNQRYGVTDVFMETSYSSAYLYNSFLATGDTSLLKNPQMIFFMKDPGKQFWKKLYEYNKGLEHKIIIHGMDFERIEFLKVLKLLAPPKKEKPKEILNILTYIDTTTVPELERIHTPQYDPQYAIYEKIRADMEQNRPLYEQYYGLNFKTVADIMFNEDTYLDYDNRNKTMYNNMARQIKEGKIKKFITFNGLNHGNKSYQGWRSLCYRLAKNKDFKNKLADIAMVCKNCYDWQLQPQYRNAAYRGPSTYYQDSVLMNNIYEKYFTPGCKYTIIPADVIDEKIVRKFSDYIILMKDQPEF